MDNQIQSHAWRKSTASNPQGNCVELAQLDSGRVAMRNSRDVNGVVLDYPSEALGSFMGAIRAGVLDDIRGVN